MSPQRPTFGGRLSSSLSDALRLRQNALDEALRRHAGPALVGQLVADIRRLTAERDCALYVEKSLRSVAGSGRCVTTGKRKP